MTQNDPDCERTPTGLSRWHSRLAAGLTGVTVVAACAAYVAWSLLAGGTEDDRFADQGIALSMEIVEDTEHTASHSNDAELDETPLSLDDATDLGDLPVINAHLEVPSNCEPCEFEPPVANLLQQLGHEPAAQDQSTGVWLKGTIEPAGSIDDADPPFARFLRTQHDSPFPR